MPHLRIPLAVAAIALLLAAVPNDASANSNEQCRSEWDSSAASNTCTIVHSIVWQSWSEECRLDVSCTRSNGTSTKRNDVTAGYYVVHTLLNCDGVLEHNHC